MPEGRKERTDMYIELKRNERTEDYIKLFLACDSATNIRSYDNTTFIDFDTDYQKTPYSAFVTRRYNGEKCEWKHYLCVIDRNDTSKDAIRIPLEDVNTVYSL